MVSWKNNRKTFAREFYHHHKSIDRNLSEVGMKLVLPKCDYIKKGFKRTDLRNSRREIGTEEKSELWDK